MSFKEITNLRKNGRLHDALQMAKADLQSQADNIWKKRAISWVYYEFVKIAIENNDKNQFNIQLNAIKELNLPNNESMLYDSLAIQIGKFLFRFKVDEKQLNTFFDFIKGLKFTKTNKNYSFLLKAFNKHAGIWSAYLEFIKWWDISNFRTDDYIEFTSENGRKLPSTVESTIIKISKKLLVPPYNKKEIIGFIPKLTEIIKNYPKMKYPPYYHAKLLLALGDKENFIKTFAPFARKNQKQFWVWDLMSEIYPLNSDHHFSCLCKSLACMAPNKYTIKVREKIARILVNKKLFPEAKHEYKIIIETRKNEGWPIKKELIEILNQDLWNNYKATSSNTNMYFNNLKLAESLIYDDIPTDIICVGSVNQEKKIINFVASKTKYGFASYKNFSIKPKPGDIFECKFFDKKDDKSTFFKLISICSSTKLPSNEIYKTIEGNLVISNANSFGFIGNVFVSPKIINEYKLENNKYIKAKAIKTYNTRRRVWGWNVCYIKNSIK